jgi:protoporphyrinogen oxidase
MKKPVVVVLGAGLSGLGAAWQLARQGRAHVCVLEQSADLGGLAGSFEWGGLPVDYGSHRLHPACDPQILDDLRMLLGDDLLTRPRHGRIRLAGRWIHFPLKATDLLTNVPWGFRMRVAGDMLRKAIPGPTPDVPPSFASVLERGLGRTICREFYFPYAQKIWGLPAEELSPIQAYRRVSTGSLGRLLRKVFAGGPGPSGTQGSFFYPRGGFGQIADALATAARAAGAEIRLEAKVRVLRLGPPHHIEFEQQGRVASIQADVVCSTIPAPGLLRLVQPAAPGEVLEASRRLRFRGMVFIYLALEQARFSEYDAHYFPGSQTPLTRLSEPKNYSARMDPPDRTVLCGELPCAGNDETWRMSDEALAQVVRQSLERCELPIQARVIGVTSRRWAHAYPLYHHGYEEYFDVVDRWLDGLDGVLSFGRQGLFAHDNIHHALAMACGAAQCLKDAGGLDKEQWRQHRVEFDKHVVVD